MKFDELDSKLRVYETTHDLRVLPNMFIVARLDGRGFTKKTKEEWQLEAPFDKRFHDAMGETTAHLMSCGFRIIYGYTQSDEISLLFHLHDDVFSRKLRKINSVLAGEASGFFSLKMGSLASFDCRVSQLPNQQLVAEYFRWRQEDAHRNSLNAHCYWLLRHQGQGANEATQFLVGKSLADKHELLFSNGINYNDLPNWQKRGVGVYPTDIEKTGFNPITNESTVTTRKQLLIDYDLLLGDAYGNFIQTKINESLSGE